MTIIIADMARELDSKEAYTKVTRILVEEGRISHLKRLSGSFTSQAHDLLGLVLTNRPEKLLIDKGGIGLGLYEAVISEIGKYEIALKQDGTILY